MKKVLSSQFSVLSSKKGVTHQSFSGKNLVGFTLVELIVYMTLLAIFLVVLTDIFVSILDVRTESEATSAVEEDGRFILSRLSYDIMRATSISQPTVLGPTGAGSTLAIMIGTVANTYSLYPTNCTSNCKLQISNSLGTNNLNGSETSASGLSFTRIGNSGSQGKDTIQIIFTLTSTTQREKGSEVRTFQTTIGQR